MRFSARLRDENVLRNYLKTRNVIPIAARTLLFEPNRPFASLRVTVLRWLLGWAVKSGVRVVAFEI